jgi:hypothetical protein
MTSNTYTTPTTGTTATADAERLLRDAAFVLRLTRRVKNDILRDAARPSRLMLPTTDLVPAALGV